jgi:hypothetical protein
MTADNGTTRGGSSGPGAASPLPSDPAAIEALIAERRAALASTIDELVVRAHPKEIARRSAADARLRVRSFARTGDGALRTERLVAVAASGAALFGLILLARRRRRR